MSSDRIFQNPVNGHRETVSGQAWLWSLLFGWFYMLTVGLWGHVFIQIFVFALIAFIGGGPFLVIAVPIVWIIYAVSIGSMLANRYLRQGWREVRATDPREPPNPPPQPAAVTSGSKPATQSVADELSKLAELRDKGLLTQEEFAREKSRLFAGR